MRSVCLTWSSACGGSAAHLIKVVPFFPRRRAGATELSWQASIRWRPCTAFAGFVWVPLISQQPLGRVGKDCQGTSCQPPTRAIRPPTVSNWRARQALDRGSGADRAAGASARRARAHRAVSVAPAAGGHRQIGLFRASQQTPCERGRNRAGRSTGRSGKCNARLSDLRRGASSCPLRALAATARPASARTIKSQA